MATMLADDIGAVGTVTILYCFLVAMWFIPSTSSNTAVTVSSEDLACWTPEKSAWSVTCTVTIHDDDAYVSSVQVKALDRFESHTIIAKCYRGAYQFSSFAQGMGQSGRQCPLPKEQNRKETYKVPFSFTDVAANSDGRISFPVRNISCGAIVYASNRYQLYPEPLVQDLISCVTPTVELPSTFNFADGSVGVVACSARNAVPEARILLTITSAANRSLYLQSATGVTDATIVISASFIIYHRATVECTVLNHAHYLAPKLSEILVYHVTRKASEIESQSLSATYGDVLNCSERVDSYPDAEFIWYMDDALAGTESSFSVPDCSSAVKLECVATNYAVNASVHVAYTLDCNAVTYLLRLALLLSVPLMIMAMMIVVWRILDLPLVRGALPEFCPNFREPRRRRQERGHNEEDSGRITGTHTAGTHTPGGDVDLHQQIPLNEAIAWSEVD